MSVHELRCTNCRAPVDPSYGQVQRCPYCGISLVVDAPQAALEPLGVATVFLEDCGPNKIAVIKVIREHTGSGLKEAKDLAESAPCTLAKGLDQARAERFRAALVREGARVTGASTPIGFSEPLNTGLPMTGIFLEDAGPNKIGVIKVIREYTGFGLKESKDIVDRAPCAVEGGWRLDVERMRRFRDALVGAGARVR